MPLPFNPFPPFEQMGPEHYAEIGLKCGLEVHQQLLTETKLFCRCPAGQYSDEYDAEILRHMRPTLSELGEYDGTALMEKKTRKHIHYRLNHHTVCTYEFDDTPPFFLNDQALDIAIELALLLQLNRVSEIHIARKQYLDGSIPTGFQRTTILGVDGWMPYGKDRTIHVRQLGLEEDSCREVSDVGHDRTYIADRLGMPLIEVVTEAEMKTPQEVAEVCQIIRKLCRSTRKVRTGYGATRQDVNVSVRGGTRVEIKGVPQIPRIPRLIYNEAMRQCSLLNIRHMLLERGVTPETFKWYAHDVSDIIHRHTDRPLNSLIDRRLLVRCVTLKKFAGLMNEQTQEHTTFAREFSDRVRVIACLTRLPNIVHSDSASELIHSTDWRDLRKHVSADPDDLLILVWGDQADTQRACDEIAIRAHEATVGIPNDTRQAHKDGTNGFERVLPGAERMYPDTDLPPICITPERVDRIAAQLPEYVWAREDRYLDLGVPPVLIERLALSPCAPLFDRLVSELRTSPTLAAIVLIERFTSLRRAGLDPEVLTDDVVYEVFRAVSEKRLAVEGILPVIKRMVPHVRADRSRMDEPAQLVTDTLADLSMAPPAPDDVVGTISRAIDMTKGVGRPFPSEEARCRYLMGHLMDTLLGCIPGTELCRTLMQQAAATAVAPASPNN
ncbi:MAG: Glu-tRNA(Gln) amidotransferase GatDE subunit E [Planctomycetes bacterium]|nr:Glu-tRNA(Gln) amidotransferase GatDE subunit E [Planctomycetota bacterium]NOG53030.1 Glu-tRNA(Gln) amidotransferase subunit GatE [Planctomycetota bacterium]